MCSYKLIAVGPIFPEQSSYKAHEIHRDIVAPLEAGLAQHLRTKGLDVCGSHSSRHPLNKKLFAQVLGKLKGLV
jgi:hypothetical protein